MSVSNTALVDIGNSSIAIAIESYDVIINKKKFFYKNDASGVFESIASYVVAKGCGFAVICSVVPAVFELIQSLFKIHNISLLTFSAQNVPLIQRYNGAGADRLLFAYAVARIFGEKSAMLIDAGSAMTIDLLENGRCFRGGYLLPGVSSLQRGLLQAAPLLPKIEVKSVLELGTNTETSIQAGISILIRGACEVAYRSFCSEVNEQVQIFVCGGDSSYIYSLLPEMQVIRDDDILFKGLSLFYKEKSLHSEGARQ